MDKNSDFTIRAVVHAANEPWVPSPMPGVDRRMLDRIGDEVARATSIVRYAPGSAFSAHTHTGGEEYLVLSGTFQDEHGDFPVGSYVRNPPQSSHTPSASDGATILVKLWQFDLDDRTAVTHHTAEMTPEPAPERPGVNIIPLHSDARETVRIEVWAPGTGISIKAHKGLEVFVLEGSFTEADEQFEVDSWLRLPVGEDFAATAGSGGTRVWIKSDHLVGPITTTIFSKEST